MESYTFVNHSYKEGGAGGVMERNRGGKKEGYIFAVSDLHCLLRNIR